MIRGAVIGLAIAVWGAAIWFWMYSPCPLVDLGGDAVEPAVVKPLGKITVTRNFRVLREEPMRVSRQMIHGDCKKSCEIVDLPGSTLALDPGEYPNFKRDHLIPSYVEPGQWRLVFTIHWQDHLGRELHQKLTELTVTVLP